MELMSVEDGLNFVEKFKRIYPNDYRDIKLSHGGSHFVKLIDDSYHYSYFTVGDLEDKLNSYKDVPNISYMGVTINGKIILNDWELLGSDEINLHCPVFTAIL
jgi:hypothetical protein